MFDNLSLLPSDPILGLMQRYEQDARASKIDLGVGVFRNEHGHTPILDVVKRAESSILKNETTKAYIGPQGNRLFNQLILDLVMGDELKTKLQDRTVTMQTPGGCGALRVAAELIKRAKRSQLATVWVSDPTWGNHIPLLGDAGIPIKTYPYYDFANHCVSFESMTTFLNEQPNEGDLILLHASCHNPSGADLTEQQWQDIAHICQKRNLIPFIDMAYQGFGEGIEQDAFGLRYMAKNLPEVLFVYSCSKNFGLYRERVGAIGVVSENTSRTQAVSSQIQNIVRGIYSMPPSHGAAIVECILSSNTLKADWLVELKQMRARIKTMRHNLVTQFADKGCGDRFSFIEQEKGMFSFLGLNEQDVKRLAHEHGIYMVGSSRINVAGLNDSNMPQFVDSICSVLG